MRRYFYSGKKLRKNVIQEILTQLESIAQVIESSSHSVRLYGASALIFYCAESADTEAEQGNIKAKAKLVDF